MSTNDNDRPPTGANRGWKIFGGVVAALFALGGLAFVAFIIFFVVAINSWGSNK